jgi:hypothetical protein
VFPNGDDDDMNPLQQLHVSELLFAVNPEMVNLETHSAWTEFVEAFFEELYSEPVQFT